MENEQIEKTCTGCNYLTECKYAYIKEIGFGCNFEGLCSFQRPLIQAVFVSANIENDIRKNYLGNKINNQKETIENERN